MGYSLSVILEVMLKNKMNEDYHLKCKFYFIPSEYAGRTKPCFSGYRGQFFYHYNDMKGSDWIAEYTFEKEPVEPGQTVEAKVRLGGSIIEVAEERGMPVGKQVAIREGAKIVAVGKIIESKYNYFNKA